MRCCYRKAVYSFAKWFLWFGKTQPSAMRRAGRPSRDVEINVELLFGRILNQFIGEDGKLNPDKFPPNIVDLSMNRSGEGGKWWFVIIPDPPKKNDPEFNERNNQRPCYGVFELKASEIPAPYHHNGDIYTFKPIHAPLDHNYQHCEIAVFKNDAIRLEEHHVKQKSMKKLRSHYRVVMARGAFIKLLPNI